MTLKNRDLEAMEKEKAIENDGSSIRAPVARLELATRGLTVRCSNQLSYTGKEFLITAKKFTALNCLIKRVIFH